jgi:hypothetical protein
MTELAGGAGRSGWTLVQISELVRRAEELLLDGIALVGPHAHAAMPSQATIEVGADELRRVGASLVEGVEISEQLELLAARLPAGGIAASYDEVRAAAAADLAAGIVEPRRALLAARMLDVSHGWKALAASLAAEDVVSTWGTLTVEALLGRFRDADPRVVAQVVEEAGLAPQTRFDACPSERLEALAAGLRRHASGQPTP